MKNEIFQISSLELKQIKKEIFDNENLKLSVLDGNVIKSRTDFANLLKDMFHLPMDNVISFDAFLDWMRDLDWIYEESIAVIIYNFSIIECSVKEEIKESFKIILNFWDDEVERVVMGGKKRRFNVYLVD